MLTISKTLTYYKREDIKKAIVEGAKDKEIAVKFGDKGFGKRPDTLQYPNDILEFAKQRATSFHASEEIWKNPLQINTNLKKSEMSELRKGWDLVLDIDCHFLDYSKIAADIIIKALKYTGISSISCKFSGNKGFHIGVPYEAFPEKIGNEKTSNLFPEAPRKIALYLKELIKEPLSKKIIEYEKGSFQNVIKKTEKSAKEITRYINNEFGDKIAKLDVEPFLEIDTILISSRHLYRMEYSFNEKSGLISIPVNPEKVLDFDKENAKPENVKISKYKFLDRNKAKRTEGKKLIVQAFDFDDKKEETNKVNIDRKYEIPENAIPEEFFPPCIKKGLKGLEDGKKRFLFILCNFLSNLGWDYDEIENAVKEWNKRNPEQLRENIVVGHIRYKKSHKKKVLPPNCDKKMYYKDMHICCPDNLCNKIKNPVQYASRKSFGNRKKKSKK
jgi:hypothetical protein